MPELLPAHRRTLQNYFMASSIEEAIAYLAAHSGEAQIVGGGTKLMPLLQRGELTATHLVDVSRIGAMKRVRLEDRHLVIGGALTYAQLPTKELVIHHLPVLADLTHMVGTSPLRQQATLAGSLVHAQSNSEAAVLLIALAAEAEITNLTGSQWIPVRALFVRPGTSRVNSSAEIVTAVRIPLLARGQGVALARTEPEVGQEDSPLIMAVVLGLGPEDTLDRLSLAMGARAQVPRLWRLGDLANSGAATVEHLRQAALTAALQACSAAEPPESPSPGQVTSTLLAAFNGALERARASLASPSAAP